VNSNCMYGEAHAGAEIAVRNKTGRTIGWLCAHHYKQHDKTLTANGYHFRTREELQARGEPNGGEGQATGATESVDETSTPQSQQPRNHDTSGHTPAVESPHERPFHRDAREGPLYGAPARRDQSSGGDTAHTQVRSSPQELEARAAGAGDSDGAVQGGTARTPYQLKSEWPEWTQGAGYLTLTPEQRDILQAPFRDEDITIRYDGVVYVPWRKYWSRMVKAFAPLVPSVIPVDSPRFQGSEIVVGVVIVVGGQFVGKAWGSHRLEGANDKMSVGDRIESAISDAIAKIGKRLDMGEQLWDEQFRAYWQSTYAEQYVNRGRSSWRRKPKPAKVNPDDELPDSWEE
jgi:hypothetical protein